MGNHSYSSFWCLIMNISWFNLTDACFDAAEQLKASVHPPETEGTAFGFGVNDHQEISWLFKSQQKLLTRSQHQFTSFL